MQKKINNEDCSNYKRLYFEFRNKIELEFHIGRILYYDAATIDRTRESNKGVMTVRKYSFLLANGSHKYIRELYVFAKYGNFVLNIQNFEKTP